MTPRHRHTACELKCTRVRVFVYDAPTHQLGGVSLDDEKVSLRQQRRSFSRLCLCKVLKSACGGVTTGDCGDEGWRWRWVTSSMLWRVWLYLLKHGEIDQQTCGIFYPYDWAYRRQSNERGSCNRSVLYRKRHAGVIPKQSCQGTMAFTDIEAVANVYNSIVYRVSSRT